MKGIFPKFQSEGFVVLQNFLRHHTWVVQLTAKTPYFPLVVSFPAQPAWIFFQAWIDFQWKIHRQPCTRFSEEKKSLSADPRSPHRPGRIISCPVTGSLNSQMELNYISSEAPCTHWEQAVCAFSQRQSQQMVTLLSHPAHLALLTKNYNLVCKQQCGMLKKIGARRSMHKKLFQCCRLDCWATVKEKCISM